MMLILGIVLCHILQSCQKSTCKLPSGNSVSDLLITVSNEHNYNYCQLLESALKGDNNSIKKLSLLDFSDAAGYDHGAVLIELIHEIGPKKYTNALTSTSKEQKNLIEGYLDVGLMYGFRKEYENKPLREVYPDIHTFLNTN